ncbi:MAG: phytoene desaturase family protein [Candidatus Hermodarchaeota archaeon]
MFDYDIIIIGGGIGGTAVGAILASKGFKTLLIEKNEFLGGRCSTYEKEGFKIDVGVHLFGRSSKGPHGKILNMIGMEDAIEWVLCRKPGPRWFYQGRFWAFPRELKEFIPSSDYSGLMKLFRDVLKMKNLEGLEKKSAKSLLTKYTTNNLVHSFIDIISLLYFVIPYYQTSASEFIRCLSSLSTDFSIGYPKGGCISIPQAYASGIEKFGGIIQTSQTVSKIVVENRRVQGIELDNGKFISSKVVISNAGIRETINSMIGRHFFNKEFLKKIDELKYSISALTFKVALKKPITKFKLITSFSSYDPEERFNSVLKGKVPEDVFLFIPIPSNFDDSLAPKGKQLLIAGTAVTREGFEKNSEKWIKNSLNSLHNVLPDLSKNLMWYDVSTPKDIYQLGGKEASVIGLAQIMNQTGHYRPSHKMPIEGLYLVGGDAGGWGIGTELAAKSALECAEQILEKKN